MTAPPKAILFDTFGTLVDWRGGVSAALAEIGARRGVTADWLALTDAWRGAYRPSLDAVREGRRPWCVLDVLHRDSILALLPEFGAAALADEVEALVAIWHRLPAWPDSVAGLRRVHARYLTAPLSNGHVALLVGLSRAAGFDRDRVYGADVFRHYKPDAQTYLGACGLLGLDPGEVALAAAHNEDLAAARHFGLQTAFISRPLEFGAPDGRAKPARDWDFVADSVEALADQLGC
jgi:2-haloacid dehalogenase